MNSFLMSAKNGDQLNQAFWKISATLAGIKYLLSIEDLDSNVFFAIGIPFNRFEQDSQNQVIPATIIDHQR